MAQEVVWRELCCQGSGCGVMFYICGSCYRGQGLLRGWLSEESATATTSQRQPETPGQPGRTARSPGPAAGLPGTAPPPCDGCNFPRR